MKKQEPLEEFQFFLYKINVLSVKDF